MAGADRWEGGGGAVICVFDASSIIRIWQCLRVIVRLLFYLLVIIEVKSVPVLGLLSSVLVLHVSQNDAHIDCRS